VKEVQVKLRKMRRTNKLRLRPTEEQERALLNLCEMSAVLWNKLNYIRRQSFFEGRFDWEEGIAELYNEFKPIIGAATAQQIIRKNDEAWRSFFALLKLKGEGSLPSHIHNISPPRYWKDRKTAKRRLMTVLRNDVYRIEGDGKKKWLVLPKGLRVRVTGSIRWRGKQGRLEIYYDDLTGRWYAYQSVEVDQPRHTSSPTSTKAFVDLGVMNIITAWIEEEKQSIAFSGKPLLSDWWYWSRKISEHQSELKRVNGRNTSKHLRKLYRRRQRRFRHAINTIVHRFIKLCLRKSVSEIIVGDVNHIRDGNNKGSKINSIIHNFWSFRYIVERLKTTAENFGIKVKLVKEYHTSSVCPFCEAKGRRIKRGLFYCPKCNQVMNADVVGCLNIAKKLTIIPNPSWGRDNGVLAHPAVLMDCKPPRHLAIQGGRMSNAGCLIFRL